MPMYDRRCDRCAQPQIDVLEPIAAPDPTCACGGTLMRVLGGITKASAVIADSIPGGIYIRHGLCHPDGTPRRFDSHSDIRRAAAKAGLTPFVRHQPPPDSDKSTHTSRWI